MPPVLLVSLIKAPSNFQPSPLHPWKHSAQAVHIAVTGPHRKAALINHRNLHASRVPLKQHPPPPAPRTIVPAQRTTVPVQHLSRYQNPIRPPVADSADSRQPPDATDQASILAPSSSSLSLLPPPLSVICKPSRLQQHSTEQRRASSAVHSTVAIPRRPYTANRQRAEPYLRPSKPRPRCLLVQPAGHPSSDLQKPPTVRLRATTRLLHTLMTRLRIYPPLPQTPPPHAASVVAASTVTVPCNQHHEPGVQIWSIILGGH